MEVGSIDRDISHGISLVILPSRLQNGDNMTDEITKRLANIMVEAVDAQGALALCMTEELGVTLKKSSALREVASLFRKVSEQLESTDRYAAFLRRKQAEPPRRTV